MEWTGQVSNVSKDWKTGQVHITFTINEPAAVYQIDDIKSCEKLSLSAKKYREKRSLDANAYAWVLMSKIAEKRECSREEVYEEMIQHYAPVYEDEDGYIVITVKNEVDMTKIDGHWRFYKGNDKWSSYFMLKGSSEYDTAEMARFIDRIIEEAKHHDIETLPPDELKRMVSLWQKD